MAPHHDRVAARAIAESIHAERVAAAIAPWLPDDAARDFVTRCITGEGPIHHRGASYALIVLAGAIAERVGAVASPAGDGDVVVPMRQPPHLEASGHAAPAYPLRLDAAALATVTGTDEAARAALTDAVIDGPPHHGLANVALLNLLAAILRRLPPNP